MTKTKIAYASALQSARESVKHMRNDLRDMQANRRKLNRIGAVLAAAIGDEPNSGFFYNSARSVHCNLDELDSFKDMRLEMVLNALENIKTSEVRTSDWPDSLNRDFHYRVDDIHVTVAAYVKNNSPTCRKVLVGTELVTKEKWEIRCE